MRLAFLILIMFGYSSLLGADKQARRQELRLDVKQAIETQHYEISIDRAISMGLGSINLSSPYSVRISSDSIYCYLPYFGRAHNIPYGGGEGLTFDSKVSSYTMSDGKNGVKQINFDAKSRDGLNSFTIDIWPEGQSTVIVNPSGRETISYSGVMNIKKEK